MPAPLFDFSRLDSIVSDDSILLSSNRRLSSQISAAWDQRQVHKGHKSWPTLPVYSLDEWVKHCWLKLVLVPGSTAQGLHCLSSDQELMLWQEIIENDKENLLLKPRATAKTLQATYRVLQLWDSYEPVAAGANLLTCSMLTAPSARKFYEHPDCAHFLRWAKQFEALCLERNFVNPTGTLKHLVCAFDKQLIAKTGHIVLVGFQHLPPLQEQLIGSAASDVANLGNSIGDEMPGASVTVNICNSVDEEISAAALWAREKIEEKPGQRIGIIVPELSHRRSQVERLFLEVFEPQYPLPETPQYQLPFNISAAIPLGSRPLIVTALTLLELNRPEIEVEDLFLLLDSAFLFFGPESIEALSRLQLSIRKYAWPKLSIEQIQTLLKQLIARQGADRYIKLANAIEQFSALSRETAGKTRTLSAWLELFSAQLESFGWPGQRRLNSIEFQQVKRWQNALQTFAGLQPVTGNVTLARALSLFRAHINSLDFQAESGPTPIQILGILEGSSLNFDAIRIVGLNDHSWPEPARPNPFIPIKLQIEKNMPHASAERELDFSRRLLAGYLTSAPETHISYSLLEQDRPLRPSALIAECMLDRQPIVTKKPQHTYYGLVHASAILESIADNAGPAINIDLEPIRGGSQILKNQAACPFKAFALHRLNARALDECTHHLSAQLRGVALHRCLESVWRQLKDFDSLLALEPAMLEQLLDRSVEYALKPLARDRADLFQPGFKILEADRLKSILRKWMQQEKLRTPFKVEAIEAGLAITIAGLPLQMRIDRIDRLKDGSLMIIDYKSARSNVNQWYGERPEDPQLPVYAISFSETIKDSGEIRALAFAQINVDIQAFTGLSASQDVAPGVFKAEHNRSWQGPTDWQQIVGEWHQSLENLADQFCRGVADVNPKNASICRFCHLQPVCRIYEQNLRERSYP